jgi:phage terminase Nu1 subunit (DNA packaging protein)
VCRSDTGPEGDFGFVTKNEIAKVLGLTPRQIENLTAEGMPRTKAGRTFEYGPDAIVWYFTRKIERIEEQRPPTAEEARARREMVSAELAEYELAQLRGQVMTIDDHDRIVARMQDRLRARHLNIPGKWAPQIVNLRSIPEAQAQLEQMMHECLLELTRVAEEIEQDDATYQAAQADDARQRVPADSRAGRRRRS